MTDTTFKVGDNVRVVKYPPSFDDLAELSEA